MKNKMNTLIINTLNLKELRNLFGQTAYIIHPGDKPDQFCGTIDCVSPHIIERVFEKIEITKNKIYLIDQYEDTWDYDFWEFFFKKETAEKRLAIVKRQYYS